MNNFYFYLSKVLIPLLNPSNLLFISSLILLFFYQLKKKKFIINILKLNIFIVILISLFPIGKLGLKYLEKDFLEQKSIPKVENIIVLGGSESLISTKVTNKLNLNAASERLIESVILSNKFKNSKIFYVGGSSQLKKNNLSEVSVAKKFYEELNLNSEKVTFIGKSRNTIENFKEIKKLNIKYENTILITSAFHMKRAMLISEKFNLYLVPYAVDFRSISNKSLLNYYQNFSISSNLSNFDLFFKEMLGIIALKILI